MSEKVRIYEIARSMTLDISGSELVDLCQRAGFDHIKHHSNAVEQKEAEEIKKAALRLYKPKESRPVKSKPEGARKISRAGAKSKKSKKPTKKSAKPPATEHITPVAPPKPSGKMGKAKQKAEQKKKSEPLKSKKPAKAKKGKKGEERGKRKKSKGAESKRGGATKTPGGTSKKRTVIFKQSQKRPESKKISHIEVTPPVTVRELSEKMGAGAGELIKKLMLEHQIRANINQELERDVIELLALDYGIEVTFQSQKDPHELMEELIPEDNPEDLEPRPPVVALLGHVDHGKTSILDRVRESRVAESEDGGITQDIGSWQVEQNGHKITFVDTPGHEAFTAMRARGANATDLVVLVVAADDGVMAQTEEAIAHARAAGVPIVVAVNKIDKPDANPMQTIQQLSGLDLVPEEWGGETGCVEISALQGKGIEELLERILLEVELLELKANPNRRADGIVLEARHEEGMGVMTNVIVRNGVLKQGDVIACGPAFGRVRLMLDQNGNEVESAGPSVPVALSGLDGLPEEGEKFAVVRDLDVARRIAEERRFQIQEDRRRPRRRVTLENLYESLKAEKVQKLNLIVKADVKGSLEPLLNTLENLNTDEISLEILHRGIGEVNVSDVLLADASDAVILAFRVPTEEMARKKARDEGIEIKYFRVIYHAVENIKKAMEGMLEPAKEEERLGVAQVRAVFNISRVGAVAGCYVQDGMIRRGEPVRLQRNGKIVYEGRVESLKREKDDAKEVKQGYECGIGLEGYNDLKAGDLIECYTIKEVARSLS